MGENGTKLYQDMERESLIELEGADEIVALDAAAVMSKLLQMANGFIYDQAHNSIHLHEAKLEALEEIVEAADAPVLVFYNFQADKDAILAKFHEARLLENDSTIEDWNRGKIKMLLAHPASAGYGLNLQEGGHIMAWYGLPWSLEQYLQAVARLQRQGQKYPVMVYHIIAKGTVDEQVMKSLQKKDITQSALIGILKDRKQGYK
jgi:SNF2 family DNA or RNA helicase